ncbi:hypothetical protein, conserved [Eimeria maxima]|uniref:Uncharacterized protein n=1 Tax=Eimeria maxima TaxID=5804 RepID=U6MBP9_EIMMA|nr:hypothetical protein, conserved [Eimeria maxima]CDJ61471.1 hypothetical protein, conserved [Eimeria maxima]
MECPVVILSKKMSKECPTFPQFPLQKIREASKRLRESLQIPEILVGNSSSSSNSNSTSSSISSKSSSSSSSSKQMGLYRVEDC